MLLSVLRSTQCVDCGEQDPVVLEFDHRDGETKKSTVSHLATRGGNVARLLEEMAKCDVRCANCHRRRTAAQRGWAKGRSPD